MSFQWMDTLEKEFDVAFVDLDTILGKKKSTGKATIICKVFLSALYFLHIFAVVELIIIILELPIPLI